MWCRWHPGWLVGLGLTAESPTVAPTTRTAGVEQGSGPVGRWLPERPADGGDTSRKPVNPACLRWNQGYYSDRPGDFKMPTPAPTAATVTIQIVPAYPLCLPRRDPTGRAPAGPIRRDASTAASTPAQISKVPLTRGVTRRAIWHGLVAK